MFLMSLKKFHSKIHRHQVELLVLDSFVTKNTKHFSILFSLKILYSILIRSNIDDG